VLALLLGGSALVIADFYVWAVSLAWIAFLIPASFIYHGKLTGTTAGSISSSSSCSGEHLHGGRPARLILLDPSRPAWLLRG